ncbi:hypothetical protein J6590_021611 [Homalodisca vitripennis]|nr:hypothetical protein J6590_021611 [Homalodisca vitripennis]
MNICRARECVDGGVAAVTRGCPLTCPCVVGRLPLPLYCGSQSACIDELSGVLWYRPGVIVLSCVDGGVAAVTRGCPLTCPCAVGRLPLPLYCGSQSACIDELSGVLWYRPGVIVLSCVDGGVAAVTRGCPLTCPCVVGRLPLPLYCGSQSACIDELSGVLWYRLGVIVLSCGS